MQSQQRTCKLPNDHEVLRCVMLFVRKNHELMCHSSRYRIKPSPQMRYPRELRRESALRDYFVQGGGEDRVMDNAEVKRAD
ncbi:hypothetical protein HJC23_008522 [Cyclotella cryptica]|uniref:Uncharacterized protein n=1 Tax=Cyclotella cryptica TaxID=29204 RepID=A0ABD3QWR3_9STRA